MLKLSWSFYTKSHVRGLARFGRGVLVASDATYYLEGGEVLWKRDGDGYAVCTNGERAVVGGRRGASLYYNFTKVVDFQLFIPVYSCVIRKDDVVVGTGNGFVMSLDRTGRQRWGVWLGWNVWGVDWNPRLKLLAVAEGKLHLLREKEVYEVRDVGYHVNRVAWCENNLAVGTCCPGKVIVYDFNKGRVKVRWKSEGFSSVFGLAWSEGCEYLAAGDSETGVLKIYSKEGEVVLEGILKEGVESLIWSNELIAGGFRRVSAYEVLI